MGATLGCGGEEFQSGSGGTSSGGTSSGGTSSGGMSSGGSSNGGTGGSGATGGNTGGVAGNVNPSGGAGGEAGTGGSVNVPGCSLKPGAPILLHTTLDDATAIQTPDTGIPPGTSSGELVVGKCPTGSPGGGGLAIDAQGDFLTYSGQGNINLVTGTLDFFFKSTAASTGTARHLVSVLGKFQVLLDQQGNLVVGVGSEVARTIPAASVPFSTNAWVRVTITWKFSADGETVNVFFDGNGVGGPFSPGPLSVPPLENDPLFIGANGENDALVAHGNFDDIKIYDGTEEP